MLGEIIRRRYQIIQHLGNGGFGETYLAEDGDIPGKPQCVVKRLKTLYSPTAKRLFTTEAEVLYRLGEHEQIPKLLAHFEEDQEFYLVHELIEGSDLSKEITPGQPWSEELVIALLQEILEILVFVHYKQVIHRNIKPKNLIRRSQDKNLFLVDFGAVKEVSRAMANPEVQNISSIIIGTPGYMPAEQVRGKPRFSSDIYAVGIICIEALTGVPALELQTDFNTNEIVWRDQVEVSSQLEAILNKMVRYDFRQRYLSAIEAWQAVVELGTFV